MARLLVVLSVLLWLVAAPGQSWAATCTPFEPTGAIVRIIAGEKAEYSIGDSVTLQIQPRMAGDWPTTPTVYAWYLGGIGLITSTQEPLLELTIAPDYQLAVWEIRGRAVGDLPVGYCSDLWSDSSTENVFLSIAGRATPTISPIPTASPTPTPTPTPTDYCTTETCTPLPFSSCRDVVVFDPPLVRLPNGDDILTTDTLTFEITGPYSTFDFMQSSQTYGSVRVTPLGPRKYIARNLKDGVIYIVWYVCQPPGDCGGESYIGRYFRVELDSPTPTPTPTTPAHDDTWQIGLPPIPTPLP